MSKNFNEGRSMVSLRIPDDLYSALGRVARRWETTLTNTIEELCRHGIEKGFCPECKDMIYGRVPMDIEKMRNCNKGHVGDDQEDEDS